MANMKPPTVPEQPVPVIPDTDPRKLLAVCEGSPTRPCSGPALTDTGMRASELIGLKVADLDRDAQVAIVLGNGRRPRACPYGQKTATAVDQLLLSDYRRRRTAPR